MLQVYVSLQEVADELSIDYRSVRTLIKNKQVIEVLYKKKVRYIIVKELFKQLSE